MTSFHTHGACWVVVLSLASVACSAPEPTDQLSGVDQPFATSLGGEGVHEAVTAEALSFLRPEIVLALQAANTGTDIEFFFESAYHFDDCNFSGASRAAAAEQAAAVQHLNPADDSADTTLLALRSFGHSLHIVQDYYAHTNWVELGGSGLVDTSLGPWATLEPYSVLPASGFVIVQGTPPAGTAVWRMRGARYPQSAVVFVQRGSERRFGLISGTVDYEPGNHCPPQVAMTHDELNKDRSTTAGRVAQHEAAKALAVQQTTHEWCRLLSMTREAWGEAGDQRLFSWVADEAAASGCGDPADLSVAFTTASPVAAAVGSPVALSLSYSNAGPATAYGTAVHLTIPAGLSVVDAGSCSVMDGALHCYVGAVGASASGAVEVSVMASAAGDHAVEATISAHVPESDAANNGASLVVGAQ